MAWFAYPEDRGTTGSSTEDDWDWNASANLATLAEDSHLTDHILDGFNLSWDGSSITVSSGIAKVTYSGGTTSYADNEDRPWPVTFVAGNTIDQSTTKAADTVWDVYITFDLAGGDNVSYVFDDTNTTPTADVVLFIGTIDTTDGTVVDDGPRRPDIEADVQSIYEAVEFENGGSTGTLQWSPTAARTIDLPDKDGTLATLGDTGSDSSVSDDGTQVVAAPSDLNFTTKLNVTDDGDGTVSIDTSALDQEEVEDAINSVVQAGTNVTTSYDDPNGVLTIDATNTTLTNEEVEDIVGTLVTGGSNVTVTYDDANDTLTIDATDTNTHPSASDDGTQVISSVDDFNFGNKLAVVDDGDSTVTVSTSALDTEEVEDAVNNLLDAGTNVTTSYDDVNNTLTINSSDTTLTNEEVEDVVGGLITGGTNVTVTYDDAGNELTVDANDTNTHPSSSDDGTQVISEVGDFNFSDKLSVADDGDSTVTVSTSALDTEEVEDAINSLLTAGSNVSLTYDDANNSLTVAATDTDTHTDVSDSGGTVVTEAGDIAFTASNDATVSVTDDGDGTATVDVDVTGTDTHTDVSDDGTLTVGDVADINFGSNVSVTDDGDGSVTVDVDSGSGGVATTETVRTNFNDVYTRLAEHDFELGLSMLDYPNGSYDIYADAGKVSSTSNITTTYGSDFNGNGYVQLMSSFSRIFHGTQSIQDMSGKPLGISFSDDDSMVAVCGDPGVFVYDTTDGTQLQNFETNVVDLYFRNGELFFTRNDGTMYVYDTSTWTESTTFSESGTNYVDIARDSSGNERWCHTIDTQFNDHKIAPIGADGSVNTGGGYNSPNGFANAGMEVNKGGELIYYDGTDVILMDMGSYNQVWSYTPSGAVNNVDVDDNSRSIFGDGTTLRLHNGSGGLEDSVSLSNEILGVAITSTDFAYAIVDGGDVHKWNINSSNNFHNKQTYTYSGGAYEGANISDNAAGDMAFATGEYGGDISLYTTNYISGTGSVTHSSETFDFIPTTVVVTQETKTMDANADVTYTITDGNGNSVTVDQTQLDTEVSTSSFTSATIDVTANLSSSDNSANVQLSEWAAYFGNQ